MEVTLPTGAYDASFEAPAGSHLVSSEVLDQGARVTATFTGLVEEHRDQYRVRYRIGWGASITASVSWFATLLALLVGLVSVFVWPDVSVAGVKRERLD